MSQPKRAAKAAGLQDVPNRPRSWGIAVSAAHMRLLGVSQKDAAESAGIAERTLRNWERAPWWPDAKREASALWLEGLTAHARAAVLKTVQRGNPEYGFRILERVVPELAPPKVRATVGTFDYGSMSDGQLARIAAGEDPAIVLGTGR